MSENASDKQFQRFIPVGSRAAAMRGMRTTLGLTQADVAKGTGVPVSVLSYIENGAAEQVMTFLRVRSAARMDELSPQSIVAAAARHESNTHEGINTEVA